MKYIKPFSKIKKTDFHIAGGKGASLGEMINNDIPVPDGYVITADTFDFFLKKTDLYLEIETILGDVDHKTVSSIEHSSEKIKGLILNAKIPEDVIQEILNYYDVLGCEYVAVRSSATVEDGVDHAWAGQLDSYLNVNKVNLIEKVKHCWSSLFTPRAIFYRFEKGLHDTRISVAVVVQKMVNSEKSGIAFSVHPVTEDRNQIIIEAGLGLGEAIVSGAVTPDSYVVTKKPHKIIDVTVNTQKKALYRSVAFDNQHGFNQWKDLSEELGGQQVLTENQIMELSNIIITIENHYGFPCDIEWAFEEGIFYITQSRPITTLKQENDSSSQISFELTFKEYHPPMWLFEWISPNFLSEYKKLFGVEFSGFYIIKNNELSGYSEVGGSEDLLLSMVNKLNDSFFKKLEKIYEIELSKIFTVKDYVENNNLSYSELCEQVHIVHSAISKIYPMSNALYILSMSIENQIIRKNFSPSDYVSPFKHTMTEKAKKRLEEMCHYYNVDHVKNTPSYLYGHNGDFKQDMDMFCDKYKTLTSLNMGVRDVKSFFPDMLEIVDKGIQNEIDAQIIPKEIQEEIKYLNYISFYKDEISSFVVPFVKYGLIGLWENIASNLNISIEELEQLHMTELEYVFSLSKEELDKIIINRKKISIYTSIPGLGVEVQYGESAEELYELLQSKYVKTHSFDNFETVLVGKVGSKGVATGVVQIIPDPSSISEFIEGNILVTAYTAPEFVPVMRQARAIITDTGGVTSHAAIVSRELGKPCITGTKFATQFLKNGDRVKVNADKGIVEILND